tara:strand:+ start:75937 stop:77241 length:1305 start_codon:yes stop_codon:yes gene_type:complete
MASSALIIILFLTFFLFLSIGVPLASALLFSSIIVVLIDPGLHLVIVPMRMYSGINNFLLLAIPGFMFAALLMNRIGVTNDIVKLSDLLVGRIRGGLAHINVLASMLMGGISGSATADVAGIGSILIPTMKKRGFGSGFAAAITASSSAIGSIIPPSILMIVYGATANISIGALFIAGYIPGILVALQQIVVSYIYSKKAGLAKDETKWTWEEIGKITFRGLIPLSVFLIIIGGIVFGIMTATEAAAVSAVYVCILGFFVYNTLTYKMLLEVAIETARLTAVVMFCVGTATLFGWLMTYLQILDVSSGVIQSFATGPKVFLFFCAFLFVVLGTFMDPVPAILIFVPVLAPIAIALGVEPILLGIIIVMTLSIGRITPPYGISLLLASSIADIPISKALTWSFILFGGFCMIVCLIILIPEVSLFLPKLLVPDSM